MFAAPMFLGGSDSDPVQGGDSLPPWDVFFCGSANDIWVELQWAAGRPESGARGCCPFTCLEEVERDVRESPQAILQAFDKVLTTSERKFLQVYKRRSPGLVYQLNQNPAFSETTGSESALGTIIRNAGTLWQSVCIY